MLLRIQLLDLGEGSDEAEARAELTESITSVIGPHLLEEDVLSRWSPQELVLLLVGTGGGRAAEIMAHLGEAVQSGALAESIPGLEFEILSGVSPVAEGETLQQAFSGARARLSSSAMTSERTRRAEEEVESEHAPILLAEDDDLTASLIEHRLGRAGYEVAHFTDGRKAWEAASEGGFSLVILDVKLPGMEGFEILEKIRSNSASADIPVILLTAMGREEDVVRGFGLGADDYVLKPFSPVELIARAQRLLRGPQKASSSTAEPRPPLDQDGI